jgi:hypothetical protein
MTDEMADYVRREVRTDRGDKWKRFDPQQLAKIIPELSQEMVRNGYEVPEEIAQLVPR